MRIGDMLVNTALRRRLDIEEAIIVCHPDDTRQRQKLEQEWSQANARVQFLDQMNRAEHALPT